MLPSILASMCQALWPWQDFWAMMSECLSGVPLAELHASEALVPPPPRMSESSVGVEKPRAEISFLGRAQLEEF